MIRTTRGALLVSVASIPRPARIGIPSAWKIVAHHRGLGNLDETSRFDERERPQQHAVDDAEDCRGRPGCQREAEDRDECEPGVLGERTNAELCVLADFLEPAGSAAFAIALFRRFDPT